ncbi:hypothetical protein ACFPOU_20805 [Massilia jejuensis]|uniref:ABC transmembrane type-1 domain-containing protein n=1 Tax=Massilia jejuensis TaxID=648894 RepID=A0ABW0PM81_9BURK
MNQLRNLRRSDAMLGFAVTLALVVVMVPLFGTVGGMVAGFAGAVAACQRRAYMDDLSTRISGCVDAVWEVEFEGVTIGTLRDADYARICNEVYGDWMRYLAQAQAYGGVLLKLAGISAVAIPTSAFWIFVIAGLASPDLSASTIRDLIVMTPAHVAQTTKTLVPLFMMGALGVAAFSRVFRATNVFDAGIADQVRRHFRVPVYGRMTLTRSSQEERAIFADSPSVKGS